MSTYSSVIFCIVSILFNTFSLAAHKLLQALRKIKKKLSVECQSIHATLLSLHGYWWNRGITKRVWVDQIDDTQKDPDQDYSEMPKQLKDQLSEAFSGVSDSVRTGIAVQRCGTFRQQSLAFGSNSWFQLDPKDFLPCHLMVLLQNWPYRNQKKCQHHFYRRWTLNYRDMQAESVAKMAKTILYVGEALELDDLIIEFQDIFAWKSDGYRLTEKI